MRKLHNRFIAGLFFLIMSVCLGCAQVAPATKAGAIKTADINNDGKPDVTYHSDGRYVSKVEADTNYDGRPDVVVNLKDGKFQSAQADSDHNGSMETKFTDVAAFNKWVNANNPEFSKKLNRPDWAFGSLEW